MSTAAISAINNSKVAGLGTSSSSQTIGSVTPEEAQDRFLKLLVAQLNNQDPMNPLDNAQMTTQIAQINTVTGIQQLNQTMGGLVEQYNATQMLQGATMVGREVLTEGNRLQVKDGIGRGAMDLKTAADSVMVEVLTPGGEVLSTSQLGSMAAGRQNFEVATGNYQGSGQLSFRVTAVRAGQVMAAAPLERSQVTSVGVQDKQLLLQLQGRAPVDYSRVLAIL